MPKGRNSNPSTGTIGNWYKHQNSTDYLAVGSRSDVTSTGSMLDMGKESRKSMPSAPPPTFYRKAQGLYDQANPFSYHDNRNNIQLKGEYLGTGKDARLLGRRLAAEQTNQHRSEISDFLKHRGREVTDSFFHTNYMLSHDSKKAELVEHRRFPRDYKEPSPGTIELPTTTVKQFHEASGSAPPHKTSNQTLVSSIEPYQKHNSWRYTYHSHGKHDIYPKAWGDRCTTHLPQYKPRSRAVIVARVNRDCTTCV